MLQLNLEKARRLPSRDAIARRIHQQRHTLLGATALKTYVSLADQSVVSGTRFITTLLIGRICGANALGSYSLAFTIYILILGAQQSLIATPYTIFGSRVRRRERAELGGCAVAHSLILTLLALAILLVMGVLFSLGVGPPGVAPLIWVLMGIMPFALIQDFGKRFAFAHLRMVTALALDVVVAVVQIGGLVALAVTGNLSAGAAYGVLGLGCAISGLAWFLRDRGRLAWRREAVVPAMKRNWGFGKWVFGSLTTSMMNGYIMYWYVALMLGTTATGIYAACMTVLLFANPFLMGLSNVLTPRAARAFSDMGHGELRRVVLKTTAYQGAFMTAFCGVVALFGGPLVSLMYENPEYAGQGLTVAVLSMGFLAGGLSLGAIDGLLALERPDINFKTSFMGLTIKLGVAALLINHWGILGAAVGSLAGSAVMSVVRWIVFMRLVRPESPAELTVESGPPVPAESPT